MIQQMTGFTLLESVLALTLSSISAATAFSYLNDWTEISERTSLKYNQQVAAYSMQTHLIWAEAEGRKAPSWEEVIQVSGVNHNVDQLGQLLLTNSNGHCLGVNSQGQPIQC